MIDRFGKAVVVAAGVAAVVLSGCEVPLGPPEAAGDVLEGVWVACESDGAGDRSRSFAFYPDASFSVTTRTHTTTDRTCGGTSALSSYEAWRYRIGPGVTAFVGNPATEVLARSIDMTRQLQTVYSIVYLDSHATPAVLYFGDLALDPARDGTAPEKRPEVLSTTALTGS